MIADAFINFLCVFIGYMVCYNVNFSLFKSKNELIKLQNEVIELQRKRIKQLTENK